MKEELLIEMENASFLSVGTSGPRLSEVNFTLSKCQHTYILGKASSGKTLFVKSLMGLIPLSEGTYYAFNRSMKNPDNLLLHYVRKKIGLLPEKGILIESLSIRENLAFPLKFLRQNKASKPYEIVEEILISNQLEQLGALMPYEVGINDRKVIGLLRALIFDPSILVLDDPYEGLDQDGIRLFHRYFQKIIKNGHTTILLFSRKPIRPQGIFTRTLRMDESDSLQHVEDSFFVSVPENTNNAP